MKIYEIAVPGRGTIAYAVKQGKYFRHWNKEKNTLYDSIWLQSEVEVLPAITDTKEFLPNGTEVWTSHGKFGVIALSQYRKDDILYPAQVAVYNSMLHLTGIYPIWENQLVKAIK